MDVIPPYDQLGKPVPGPYQNGNPSAGILGSIPNADFFTAVLGELLAIIDAAGIPRDAGNLKQVLHVLRSGLLSSFADSGTADALVVTPPKTFASLVLGTAITVLKNNVANATTSPTLTVTTPGGNTFTRPILKEDGTALAIGDLPASSLLTFKYDGLASFRLVGLRKSDIVLSQTVFNSLLTTALTQIINNVTPAVLNGQQLVSSFSPNLVLSDLPYNVETVVKSLAIPTGTSYADCRGQLAYRNDATSRVSFITELRLHDTSSGTDVTAQYIGGAMPTGGGPQQAQPTQRKFIGMNPQHSYVLQLIGFKIDNQSPLLVLDAFLEIVYA